MNRSCYLATGSLVAFTKSFNLGLEKNHKKVSVTDDLLILASQRFEEDAEGLCPVWGMMMRMMKFYTRSKIK